MFSFLKLIAHLPLWMLYLISDILQLILPLFYRKNIIEKNLSLAFPEKSEKQLQGIRKKYYQHLADLVVEIIKSGTITQEQLSKRVVFKNPEISYELAKKQESLLFFTSHAGNWEWIAQACGLGLSTPGHIIYKPLKNKAINRFLLESRARFGGRAISKKTAIRTLIKLREKHCIIGIAADQAPIGEKNLWTTFLNQETDFNTGLIRIPELMNSTAVFGKVIKVKRGYYEVTLIPLTRPTDLKKPTATFQRYVEELESLVKEHPVEYLWSHNRWKNSRKEDQELFNFS